MANIFMTSFRESRRLRGELRQWEFYSVARWQPRELNYRELPQLAAFRQDGSPLRLRDFDDPLEGYRKEYLAGLEDMRSVILPLLERIMSYPRGKHLAFCCWCPHSKASQNQLAAFGTFACHTMLLAGWLEQAGFSVALDLDRSERGVKAWLDA